jgi:hypothetical protein
VFSYCTALPKDLRSEIIPGKNSDTALACAGFDVFEASCLRAKFKFM